MKIINKNFVKIYDTTLRDGSQAEGISFSKRDKVKIAAFGSTKRNTNRVEDDIQTWGTVGVSENTIEASWEALVDSVEYILYKRKLET
jgi:hypothetical protein